MIRLNLDATWRSYLSLLILAVGIAALTMFLLSRSMTPYQLRVIQQSNSKDTVTDYILYHDFNKDGISETLYSKNDRERGKYYVVIRDFDGQTIDQCNYQEPTYYSRLSKWLFFEDYNGDNLDDMFTFTQKKRFLVFVYP